MMLLNDYTPQKYESLKELNFKPSDFVSNDVFSAQPFSLLRTKFNYQSTIENDNYTNTITVINNDSHAKSLCKRPQFPNIPQSILDNLSARFLINIPQNQRSNSIHVLFMCQEAYWFYLDYCLRDYDNKMLLLDNSHNSDNINSNNLITYKDDIEDLYSSLPRCGFSHFAYLILRASGVLSFIIPEILNDEFLSSNDEYAFGLLLTLIEEWKRYRSLIPVCGALILDESLSHVLLVRGYGAKNNKGFWSFPRGKINEAENECECAIREVLEETGLDITQFINNKSYITLQQFNQDTSNADLTSNLKKIVKLFIISGVSKQVLLKPQARYEIQEIKWFPLKELYSLIKEKDSLINSENYFSHSYLNFNKYDIVIKDPEDQKFYLVDYFLKQLAKIMIKHCKMNNKYKKQYKATKMVSDNILSKIFIDKNIMQSAFVPQGFDIHQNYAESSSLKRIKPDALFQSSKVSHDLSSKNDMINNFDEIFNNLKRKNPQDELFNKMTKLNFSDFHCTQMKYGQAYLEGNQLLNAPIKDDAKKYQPSHLELLTNRKDVIIIPNVKNARALVSEPSNVLHNHTPATVTNKCKWFNLHLDRSTILKILQ
ncbi:unnamed protein product [Gordionus sp. m RMFG-2023]